MLAGDETMALGQPDPGLVQVADSLALLPMRVVH